MDTITVAQLLCVVAIALVLAGILWNVWLTRRIKMKLGQASQREANLALLTIFAGVFTCVLCFLMGLITMRHFGVAHVAYPASSPEQSMFEMQGITLAVTALAVAMVSLIGGILSLQREQKLEKYEAKLQSFMAGYEQKISDEQERLRAMAETNEKKLDAEKTQLQNIILESNQVLSRYDDKVQQAIEKSEKALGDTLQSMNHLATRRQDINAINALDKNIRHLPLKERLLLERYQEFGNERHMLIGLIDFYMTKAEVNTHGSTRETQIRAYHDAEKHCKQLLSIEGVQEHDKVFAKQQLAEAYYQLGRLHKDQQPTEAEDRLRKSAALLLEIGNDLDVDAYGHLSNQLGLVYYWLYNIDRKKNFDYLALSKEPYKRAIGRYPGNGRYHRNLGVTVLNQASLKKPEERTERMRLIERAKQYFQDAARYDPNDALAFVDIADACIHLLSIYLEIKMVDFLLSRDYDQKCACGFKANVCTDVYCRKVENLFDEADESFQHARRIGPMAINVHYKHGQLFTLKYHYHRIMGNEDRLQECNDRAIAHIQHALSIQDKNLGSLHCLRNHYECTGKFDDAIEVSEQICQLQHRDKNAWRDALEKYRNVG